MTIRPLVERVKDIKLADDDTGIINDTDAAARNRANIDRMRAKGTPHHSEGGLRVGPLLPKREVTKQEEDMGNKHINDGRDWDTNSSRSRRK